ncbi:MAG: site-specific DNA-methyltransferase [Candidatus Atribacteria bacterium]|nr:site-specific DNA-methyltransferase [Candidatus Atribacteria bacterium]
MTTGKATLIEGDCLPIMQGMEADSVDLVFCSPPYEAARTYGIAFNLRGQEWVNWAVPRYMECCRICKGLVAWVVEGQTKDFRWSATPLLLMADLHRAGVRLRKPPIFKRVGIPGSGGPDWWRNDYEFIVCASKGRLPWSDNTANGHPPRWAPGGAMSHRVSSGGRVNQWGHSYASGGTGSIGTDNITCTKPRPSHKLQTRRKANGERLRDGEYTEPVLANAGNVVECIVGGGVMGSDFANDNEAPFPEDLVRPFVECFCPPGGVVLDPFSGSGTTVAVAVHHGRNAIGIDIRESQIELARKRIAAGCMDKLDAPVNETPLFAGKGD